MLVQILIVALYLGDTYLQLLKTDYIENNNRFSTLEEHPGA